MARLPALISTYAEFDGRPRKAIEWYARVARENGKITTSKRGAGAAHMCATDAVNLILACNGADEAKEGPLVIDQLRSLRRATIDSDDIGESSAYEKLLAGSTFAEALETLIADAELLKADLKSRFKAIFPNENAGLKESLFIRTIGIEVTIWKYGAEISAWSNTRGPRENYLRIEYTEDFQQYARDFYTPVPPRFRSIRTILTFDIFDGCSRLILTPAKTKNSKCQTSKL